VSTIARSLRQLCTAEGRVAAVALDQRQSLRRMLADAGQAADDAAIAGFKLAIAHALADVAPALLIDPEIGLPALASDPELPARLPLIVALEESGTVPWEGGRRSLALSGYGPLQARCDGAAAGKLLVYLRPDHGPTTAAGLRLIRATRIAARDAGLPFVLELVPFQLDGEDDATFAHAYGDHVRACAELGQAESPDLLKLPWPDRLSATADDAEGVRRLAGLSVPWALLSAGAGFERFERRLLLALDDGGACGFIAGRAVDGRRRGGRPRGRPARGRPRAPRAVARADGRARAHARIGRTTRGIGMAGRLAGKIALVTGGGSGMGRAGAVAMAAEGAHVFVCDLDGARAEAVQATIAAAGDSSQAITLDVTDEVAVERAVADIVARHGRLDVLYTCAIDSALVSQHDGCIIDLDQAILRRIVEVNLFGALFCAKHAGRQMAHQGSGSIVFSGTCDGLIGCAGLDAYTAAKGGVMAMTRSLAAGIGGRGVRVNAICPGFVRTEAHADWLADERAVAAVQRLHILPMPDAEGIAPLVVYLASDEAACVTGSLWPIDSGYTAFKVVDADVKQVLEEV
jgi:NAD(P)-dependent dehydrogenase (short-subunit alcohol dehydrogenase family)/tagatose-1,6-bisphosphate aldolase